MKVLVFGATGGSGRAAIEHLLEAGHEVSAFVRDAAMTLPFAGVKRIVGDVMLLAAVEAAVAGHDAVIVTIGIRENPIRVRLFGPARTPPDVRSAGTHNIIRAMRKHCVRKLIVQTSYGVGDTRDRLRLADKLLFEILLKPQIADTEKQNAEVAASGLDWILVQPVHLTSAADGGRPFVSFSGAIGKNEVSRDSVGQVLARAVGDREFIGKTVAVSGQL